MSLWKRGDVLWRAAHPADCSCGSIRDPGQSVTEVLAAVIRAEPDWSALPRETPSRIRELLQRWLRKDPKQRVHDIADARLEIEEALTEPAVPGPRATPTAPSWRGLAAGAVAVLAIGIVVGWGMVVGWLERGARRSSMSATPRHHSVAVCASRLRADEPVVVRVSTNPEPDETIG